MIKYLLCFFVIFAVLIFLRYCEGSPFRSWKAVLLTGIPLSLIAGYYFSCAMPPKPPPLPQAQKADAYRAELQRTFRRIAGVQEATIEGSTVQINFAEDKPTSELKQIALHTGGAAAYFLKTNSKPVKVTVHMSVRGRDRYEVEYESGRGVINEQSY